MEKSIREKIVSIYPDLDLAACLKDESIRLENKSDGRGDYIEKWAKADYPQPTVEQLAAA